MSTAVMTSSSLYDFNDIVIKSQSERQLRRPVGSNNSMVHHHDLVMSKLSWGLANSSSGSSSAASSPVESLVQQVQGQQQQGQDGAGGGGGALMAAAAAAARPNALPLSLATIIDEMTNSHRRLDRSQSEPSKTPGMNVNTSRYKTELCRPYEESGQCKYGDKCQFAHGEHELRGLVRHPKYKTELCRTFHTIGFCPYGPRCHFIHNADEARGSSSGGGGGGGSASSPTGVKAPVGGGQVAAPRCLPLAPLGSASPASSLGSISPPPPPGYSFAASSSQQTPPTSPPPPPGSPDSSRLPVFNRISSPPFSTFKNYNFPIRELLA